MTSAHKDLIDALLDRYGQTYCDQLHIPIADNTPSPLFRWLCASILFSARIGAAQALEAAAALADAGWTTPEKLKAATWKERVDVLNKNGYARYDESTSRMLGDTADYLIETYDGDLRALRKKAGRDEAEMRNALKAFKGLGDVGVDIFFREVQTAWGELYPFADKKSLDAARELGLPHTAQGLSKHVAEADFPRLVTALVRASLDKSIGDIRQAG
ncbi:hypothetical protein [uncultured Pelagibacterium sp.]|uniref:hypothetical protein n=1 Tax=uncultured Pelagibacterium sp. TaxID=1159875 RepID=UPI0030D87148|tara:strand:- start:2210 stop:2857 length:648 start_codon:yes stop_codon:yes gene_type:complete